MIIHGYGCSWTAGVGCNRSIEDTLELNEKIEFQKKNSWVRFLSEKLNGSYINNGVTGNSNNKVFNKVVKDVQDNFIKNDDLIVIMWSSSLRDNVQFLPKDEWLTYITGESRFLHQNFDFYQEIHITEKSFKPFLALQFPLILATHHHINKMKEIYNLDFFDDIINNDYDNIEEPRERLFRFIDEVKRIHNNKDFFIDFYRNNKDRFIENQNKVIKFANKEYDKNFLLSLRQKIEMV